MDEERKGQIAYHLWKRHLKQEGIHLDGIDRKIGNIVKETGVPREELQEFMQEIVTELLKEAFESKE